MKSSTETFRLNCRLLAIGLATALASCAPVPDDPECITMRGIGRSAEKIDSVKSWIDTVLSNPRVLSSKIGSDGLLHAGELTPDLDWAGLDIPDFLGQVEFFGESLDLTDLKAENVEAVVLGYGHGYRLIIKLDPETKVEERIFERTKRPYHPAVKLEALDASLTLVCQVNDFG